MKIEMNNSIFELVKSHCVIFDTNLQNVKLPVSTDKSVQWIFQLDFLAWYVDQDRVNIYWIPWFNLNEFSVKDNPNWIPTDYENVFMKVEIYWENIGIDYQLVIPWKSPIAILNRYYFKVREWNKYIRKWRISVYWKALKMYYMWYIPRLKDYIIRYSWVCCRADLCRDFPTEIPSWIIDLKISWTNHDTVYLWEKNSPIFFRIYNKTQDLKREKNCFAWLYPSRYIEKCRRLEAQLTWQYSRSMSPLDWLDIMKVDKSVIKKIEQCDRNVWKTNLYSSIDLVDRVQLSTQEKIMILENSKNLIDKKLKKLMILPIKL